MTDMTVGELAAGAGVGVETIRYYEREGVLPAPARAASGYRVYGDDDLWRLAFVQRAKAFGFSLREVAELLGAGADRSVAEVRRLTRRRLELIEDELDGLTRRRDMLRRLLVTCDGGADDDCLQLAAAEPTEGEAERERPVDGAAAERERPVNGAPAPCASEAGGRGTSRTSRRTDREAPAASSRRR